MSWLGPCCQQERQDQQVVHIALGKVELNWASQTDQSAATPTNPPTTSHAKTYNCSEDNPILDILDQRDFVFFNVHTKVCEEVKARVSIDNLGDNNRLPFYLIMGISSG